jgi:hypothetical protein
MVKGGKATSLERGKKFERGLAPPPRKLLPWGRGGGIKNPRDKQKMRLGGEGGNR